MTSGRRHQSRRAVACSTIRLRCASLVAEMGAYGPDGARVGIASCDRRSGPAPWVASLPSSCPSARCPPAKISSGDALWPPWRVPSGESVAAATLRDFCLRPAHSGAIPTPARPVLLTKRRRCQPHRGGRPSDLQGATPGANTGANPTAGLDPAACTSPTCRESRGPGVPFAERWDLRRSRAWGGHPDRRAVIVR